MSTDKEFNKSFVMDEELNSNELSSKSSTRALQIRRALENRKENKKYNAICGDDYWEDI